MKLIVQNNVSNVKFIQIGEIYRYIDGSRGIII